jgi:hypothetical protein
MFIEKIETIFNENRFKKCMVISFPKVNDFLRSGRSVVGKKSFGALLALELI